MSRARKSLLQSTGGAVAPTVALSLFALIAAGGIAFDYARLAGMDSELQSAADQAALAAASQLDGATGACSRAANAARNLIANSSRFANDAQRRASRLRMSPPAMLQGQSVSTRPRTNPRPQRTTQQPISLKSPLARDPPFMP
ncbi:pilus assembly protein TadG-related protein [Sphingobium fuliginis]|uniref:pilus assembly protein TadG-related protein n=1 Tax=Sphingobium fuliginis (strain ATCC 27551) TaxID=336203 RepID=UPI0012FF38E9